MSREPSFSRTEFRSLLRTLLSRRVEGTAASARFLPVAEMAAASPSEWVDGFSALELDDQFELLDRLAASESGPAAEFLMLLLAQYSHGVSDDMVRGQLLQEQSARSTRQVARLQNLRHEVERVTEETGKRQAWLGEDFDLAAELATKEAALACLRQDESARDDRFYAIHTVEAEILRLEMRKAALAQYDPQERARRRDALASEIWGRQAERDELETEVARLQEEAAPLQNRVADLRTKFANASAELQNLHRQKESLARDTGSLQIEVVRVQEELTDLQIKSNALKEQRKQQIGALQSEREAVETLRTALANEPDAAALREKLHEVYRMLPTDDAEKGF